jgi:hypothetical protein
MPEAVGNPEYWLIFKSLIPKLIALQEEGLILRFLTGSGI